MLEQDFLIFLAAVALLSMIGVTPIWGWSRNWGLYPMGGTGLLLIVLLILLLTGHRM